MMWKLNKNIRLNSQSRVADWKTRNINRACESIKQRVKMASK
jgi:hypothetical protein